MIGLSVIGGQKAIETLEAVLEGSNPYTSAAAAVALEQITQSDALDVLLLRMKGRNSKVAARATAAAAVMISDPRRAITFMNKISRLPPKYRKQLMYRAVMAVTVGPRTQKAWVQGVKECTFQDMELSQAIQFIRDVVGAGTIVDWRALAQLGVKSKTIVNLHLQNVTFDTALKLILIDVAGPGKLAYKIDSGKIRITRAAKARIPPLPSPIAVLTETLYVDGELRLRAAEALGNIGPPAKTAIGALTKMLKDKDKNIQKVAGEAIRKIKSSTATKPKP